MRNLLPQELLEEILRETGAVGGAQTPHFVKSVSHFRPFQVKRKAQSEFNLAFFDKPFQRASDLIQKDWNKNFVQSCPVTRQNTQVTHLTKYRFREQAYCVSFTCEGMAEPFFAYFDLETFYFMLNHYFGGGSLRPEKSAVDLTKIEEAVMAKICSNLGETFSSSFQLYHPTKLSVRKTGVSTHEQDEYDGFDYLVLDFALHGPDNQMPFSFAIPMDFLRGIVKSLERQGREHRMSDPAWQKLLNQTVLASNVELQVNVTTFEIPFEKSFHIREGDFFSLDHCGPQVTLSILGKPHLRGTIGTVGENYAVKIEENLP